MSIHLSLSLSAFIFQTSSSRRIVCVLRCFRLKCRGDFRGLGFIDGGSGSLLRFRGCHPRVLNFCSSFDIFSVSFDTGEDYSVEYSALGIFEGEIIPSSILLWAFSTETLHDSKLRRVVSRAIISSSWAFFPPRNSGVSKVQLLSSLPLRRGGGGPFDFLCC